MITLTALCFPSQTQPSGLLLSVRFICCSLVLGDCDAGIHQGAIPKHRLVTKHGTPRSADLRRRVTLTDCDTDSGRRHLKVGRCRRRHSIHDLDDQRAVSAMDGILLDVGHAGRSEEACYLDALHPNSRYADGNDIYYKLIFSRLTNSVALKNII